MRSFQVLFVKLNQRTIFQDCVGFRRSEIRQFIADGHAAQRGTLTRDGVERGFVGGISFQPEILADHGRIVIQRETAEGIRCAASTAREVCLIEFVVPTRSCMAG